MSDKMYPRKSANSPSGAKFLADGSKPLPTSYFKRSNKDVILPGGKMMPRKTYNQAKTHPANPLHGTDY